jgi:hypothetical protein
MERLPSGQPITIVFVSVFRTVKLYASQEAVAEVCHGYVWPCVLIFSALSRSIRASSALFRFSAFGELSAFPSGVGPPGAAMKEVFGLLDPATSTIGSGLSSGIE